MTTSAARIEAPSATPGRNRDDPAARERFETFLRWTIEDEFPNRGEFLEGSGLAEFAHYYSRLPAPADRTAIQRYVRGLWRAEAGWAARWIAAHPAPDVLDAGCGYGTFAMAFAAIGARVLGADLRPDRLEVANARLAHCERCTGRDLDVSYGRFDVTSDWGRDFDLVWVYNALSHIEPVDGFLEQVGRRLRRGGVIVIADINGAHPSHARRLAALRSQVTQDYVAPDGRRHAYAVERSFSPLELRRELELRGFSVVAHELYWRGMSLLPDPWHEAVISLTRPLQWLQPNLASRQLLVASREGLGRPLAAPPASATPPPHIRAVPG